MNTEKLGIKIEGDITQMWHTFAADTDESQREKRQIESGPSFPQRQPQLEDNLTGTEW